MMVSLADLSTETIIHIFSYLDLADLARAKRLSSYFRDVIERSLVLMYRIALDELGMVEGIGGSKYDTRQKLEMLDKRRKGWHGGEHRNIPTIRVSLNHKPSHIYDLSGGVYFLGDCHDQMGSTRTLSLRYLDLSTQEPGLSRWESLKKRKDSPWPELTFEGQIVDFGVALEEHDLLVVLCKETDVTADPVFQTNIPRLYLQLVQFSTGKPHPLAENPTINIFSDGFPSRVPPWTKLSAMIEIVGPRLVILVNWKSQLLPTGVRQHSGHFFVINWWTGQMQCCEDAFGHVWDGFVFLSEDLILRPNISTRYLEVVKLPDVVNDSSEGEDDSSIIIALLLLPELAEGHSFSGISSRADPNPFGRPHPSLSHLATGAGGWKPYHHRPFFPSAADAIILFKPTIYASESRTILRFWFVIHRSSILRILSTPSPREEQCVHFQDVRMCSWEKWGQENTYWSDSNDDDLPWITVSSGQRAAFNRNGKITVYDFNPYSVKRAAMDGISIPNTSSSTVPFTWGVFREEIRNRSSFLESSYGGDIFYRGVLMQENYILGLKTDPIDGKVRELDILDTSQP